MENGRRMKNKKRRWPKVLLIIFLVILVILGGMLTTGYLYVNNKLSKINYESIDESEIEITEGIKQNLKGHRNIVLLGIDTENDSYTGARSDGIIIISINEKTKKVKLASVYRDTYLEIPGRKLDKVNHAYAFGGPALTMSTLNTNLDLNITEYVTVNFTALQDIVNQVGGIKMKIDSDEVSHISGINSPGTHNLNGSQALQYARIRKAAGGDYKRTERMRDVLMAVFDKAKSLSISELNRFADKVLPEIRTNVTAGEIMAMMPQMVQYDVDTSIGWPYEVQGSTIGAVWYGVPVDLEKNVSKLHKELFGIDDYKPSQKVKEISNKIKK